MTDTPTPQAAVDAAHEGLHHCVHVLRDMLAPARLRGNSLGFRSLKADLAAIIAKHIPSMAELATVKQQRDGLLAALRTVEYPKRDGAGRRYCGGCGRKSGHPHGDMCQIGAAIAAVPTPAAQDTPERREP